jgi:hypothetical protein
MPGTANSIITPQTPKSAMVIYAIAQATYPPTTTPANTALLMTAGANGARLVRLYAMPQESTAAACIVQYFRSVDGGTTKYWAGAALGTNDTVSSTDIPIVLDFGFSDDNPMILQANEKIYVAPSIAKNFAFVAEWADY